MPTEIDGPDTFRRSVTAFRLADGQGCARLLAHDDARSALLLERLGPNLVDLGFSIDQQLVGICAALRQLWRPVLDPSGLQPGDDKAHWLADHIVRWWEELDHPCAERTVATVLGYAEGPVEPIWQWGSIGRVATGLNCLTLDEEQGHGFLAVADRWAEGAP